MTNKEKINLLTNIARTLWHELMTESDTDRMFDLASLMDEIGIGSYNSRELNLSEMSNDLWICENITRQLKEYGCLDEQE